MGMDPFTLYNCTFWEYVDGTNEKAKPLKFTDGPEDGGCPPRMQCFPFEYEGVDYLDDGAFPEYDNVKPNGFCDCNTWNWFTGPACDEHSGYSMMIAALFWILMSLSVFVFAAYSQTVFKLFSNFSQKGRWSFSTAVMTLLGGQFTSFWMSVYIFNDLGRAMLWWDPTPNEIRASALLTVTVAGLIPTLLVISTMWLEVYLKTTSQANATKAEREALKAKMTTGIIVTSLLMSVLIFVFLVVDESLVLIVAIVVVLGILFIYGFSGRKLALQLNKVASGDDGADEVKEGAVHTCVKITCCMRENTKDMASTMITKAAANISHTNKMTLLGCIIYVGTPEPGHGPSGAVKSFGAVALLGGLILSTWFVLLYLRFGLRKQLGLDFEGNYSTGFTTTTTAATTTTEVVVSPAGNKVAPGN